MLQATAEIKERLSIDEVIGTYIKIEATGANFKARCPFHNEKTPSFFISPARGSYYCFGCGVKGDIFSFVQAIEGIDFKGALKILADRAHVTLTNYGTDNRDEKEELFRAMEEATKFYEQELTRSTESMAYLRGRGLTDETIASFRIGFAPDGWRSLSTYLMGKKFNETTLEKAGLIKKTDRGFYDRFRNRVMFPIFDSSGRVIAFSGRTMVTDENTPKYLNSPDTPLFDKSSALYGIDRAREWIRKRDYAIVVEGQFDLILSHQAGVINTVAASGTALSDSDPSGDRGVANLQMLARFSKNLLFAFDGDKAGINATYRGTLLALGLGMDVKITRLPAGRDPADVIKDSKDEWLTLLKETEPAVLFFARRSVEIAKDERDKIKLIHQFVLPLLLKIDSALVREHFLKRVSEITQMSYDSLQSDLGKVAAGTPVNEKIILSVTDPKQKLPYTLSERLYGIIFWQEALEHPYVDPTALEAKLKSAFGDDRALTLRDSASEHKEELIFEAEAGVRDGLTLMQEFDQMLLEFRLREIRKELTQLAVLIRQEEQEGKDISSLLETVTKTTALLQSLESQGG